MYRKLVKPMFDFTVSTICFIIILPLFLFILILLAFLNRGTPFFVQCRPGQNARIFRVIKFKTMTDKYDHKGNLLPDSERLTTVGRFVRSTSLDELPQLINIIKGDMSLVGPRPLLPEYLPLYNKFQARRHEVRPGITGWAQVNGRNAISWEDKFKFDVWYVDNMSFALDMKILLMTIGNVIMKKDISKEGFATTLKFNGQN